MMFQFSVEPVDMKNGVTPGTCDWQRRPDLPLAA
jgi:hypothetical protein